MDVALQLQIISISMANVGVALPALIGIVGFLYVRSLNERIDNLSDQIDELWDHVSGSKK